MSAQEQTQIGKWGERLRETNKEIETYKNFILAHNKIKGEEGFGKELQAELALSANPRQVKARLKGEFDFIKMGIANDAIKQQKEAHDMALVQNQMQVSRLAQELDIETQKRENTEATPSFTFQKK